MPSPKALVKCSVKVLLADFPVIEIRTRKFKSKALIDGISFSMTIFNDLELMKVETVFAIIIESECDVFFALMEKFRFSIISKRDADSWIEVPVCLIAGSEEHENAHENQKNKERKYEEMSI